MFNKIFQNFNLVTGFYYNSFILSGVYKCTISQLTLPIRIHDLTARGYSVENPSSIVFKKYEELYANQLKEMLKDPNIKATYDKLKLELEHMKCHTSHYPKKELTAYNWLHLLKCPKTGQRRGYLNFLWKVEKKVENERMKKKLKQKVREDISRINDAGPYGLKKCTLFHRIRESTIIQFYNTRLISAMLYEPTIVFDLGYDNFMTQSEQQNCAKQLLLAFSENRNHNEPLNLHFCNANANGLTMQSLHKLLPKLYDIDFPLNISSQSYLDFYDKKQLVYLTPHTNIIMTQFDPKVVYIIGAIVDKTHPKPLSFQKAKEEGIRMMRLPLGEKLEWGTGSTKNLPLNQIMPILLELRHTNNWLKAFKYVPKRKLREARTNSLIRKIEARDRQLAKFME